MHPIKMFLVGIVLIFVIFISSNNLLFNMIHAGKEQVRIIFLGDNFHEVDKDNLYRCRQLSDTNLEQYINQYNIKTILNVRGYDEEPEIRKREQEICKKNNVLFFGVPIRGKSVSEYDIQQVMAILETTPRPIIVHCYAGADRTGLTCALYRLLNGRSIDEALQELSVRYGHFSWLDPVFKEIITNIENTYPNIITSMKKQCSHYHFSMQELEGIDAQQLLDKISGN